MKYTTIFALLLLATILEAGGDAIVRIGLNTPAIPTRVLLMLSGGAILFGYGLTLNLAPLDFGPLIGAYPNFADSPLEMPIFAFCGLGNRLILLGWG
jgi:hypothetical protein